MAGMVEGATPVAPDPRRDRIVTAIREWAAMFGEPPTVGDWYRRPAWRARRVQSTGRTWPSPGTVINWFGSWNAGIHAAGFDARPAHWPPGPRAQGHQRFCRGCGCFVNSPHATCRNCGKRHDRDDPALEEPIRLRRPSARTIPTRKLRR